MRNVAARSPRGVSLWAIALLLGCGPSATQQALIAKQSAPYRRPGDSVIAGQAFLVTSGGRRIPGSAEEVYLTPVTTWAESRIGDVLASNEIPESEDRAAEVWWTGRANAEGRFSFRELPAGEYYVLSPIAYAASGAARETIAFARVRIGSGQTVEVEVTRTIDGE